MDGPAGIGHESGLDKVVLVAGCLLEGGELVAAAFGLGLLAASVSWYLLEKPLQALRRDGPAVSVVPPEVEAAPAPARA